MGLDQRVREAIAASRDSRLRGNDRGGSLLTMGKTRVGVMASRGWICSSLRAILK